MQDGETSPIPPSLPPSCLLPAQALHARQRPVFTGWRGHGWEALLPDHDSPKSGDAGAGGPGEDDRGAVLIGALLLLLLSILPRSLLPAAEHPQLVQGQAELWAQAGAMSAESRGGH